MRDETGHTFPHPCTRLRIMLGHIPALAKPDKYEFLSEDIKSIVRLCQKYNDEMLQACGAKGHADTDESDVEIVEPTLKLRRRTNKDVAPIVECPFTDDFDPDDYMFDDAGSAYPDGEEAEQDIEEDDCKVDGYICRCSACMTPSELVKDVEACDDASDSSMEARNAPIGDPTRGGQKIHKEKAFDNANEKKRRKIVDQASQKLPQSVFKDLSPQARLDATRRAMVERRRITRKTNPSQSSKGPSPVEHTVEGEDEVEEIAKDDEDLAAEPAPVEPTANVIKKPCAASQKPGPPGPDPEDPNIGHDVLTPPFKMETRRGTALRVGESYLLHSGPHKKYHDEIMIIRQALEVHYFFMKKQRLSTSNPSQPLCGRTGGRAHHR